MLPVTGKSGTMTSTAAVKFCPQVTLRLNSEARVGHVATSHFKGGEV